MKEKSWDIFCKVVDNFGDIGVCWRLAKQLHHDHHVNVRLFIDKLDIARHILVGLQNLEAQDYDGVHIIRWRDDLALTAAADVVLETFACGLPDAYLALMPPNTIWINVDYLSAESWVPSFHGLNGQHPETNFTRHFYFPGFTEDTGGLFREQDLIKQRDAFQQSEQSKAAFWQRLGVDDAGQQTVSLFSYENALVEALLSSIADHGPDTIVLMPKQSHMPEMMFGNNALEVGDVFRVGHLSCYVLPFLSQADYDKLLWASDINFVRGEDSWLRALWAAKPFIWQPYPQVDDAHLVKLNAFIDTFYPASACKNNIAKLHQDWSTGEFSAKVWACYLKELETVRHEIAQQTAALATQAPLASKLIAFCEKVAK